MLAFLNPESDPLGKGFHIIQSLIAVGSGGFRGVGFMDGRQKLFYLPEPHTDYIFANISEELGLIGALIVVGLFVFIGWRGMRAAILSKDPFARFLAFGITATILIQAFFNISVVLALVPTKGITLPFVSYGGTSLFIMLALLGVLRSGNNLANNTSGSHSHCGRGHGRAHYPSAGHCRRAEGTAWSGDRLCGDGARPRVAAGAAGRLSAGADSRRAAEPCVAGHASAYAHRSTPGAMAVHSAATKLSSGRGHRRGRIRFRAGDGHGDSAGDPDAGVRAECRAGAREPAGREPSEGGGREF
jgi:hypothetical protein